MGRVLPMLFNTDMVRAILDGRKTATRRAVRYRYSNTEMQMHTDRYGTRLIEIQKDVEGETHGRLPDGRTWHELLPYIEKGPPCRKGDILYVRETWNHGYIETSDSPGNFEAWFEPLDPDGEHDTYIKALSSYFYKADKGMPWTDIRMVWRPSIHMPRGAARIWLNVTDVRVERLQEITIDGCEKEGCWCGHNGDMFAFMALWDSTIKKSESGIYGWDADPWVWVIEFERCGKPEGL